MYAEAYVFKKRKSQPVHKKLSRIDAQCDFNMLKNTQPWNSLQVQFLKQFQITRITSFTDNVY